jgi:hypothetical protein
LYSTPRYACHVEAVRTFLLVIVGSKVESGIVSAHSLQDHLGVALTLSQRYRSTAGKIIFFGFMQLLGLTEKKSKGKLKKWSVDLQEHIGS